MNTDFRKIKKNKLEQIVLKFTIVVLAMWIFLLHTSCSKINEPQSNEDWSFLVYSDVRLGYSVYKKLANNMGSVNPAPKLAFCLGDIIVDPANETEWDQFWKFSQPITKKMPLYLARGNHEENDPLAEHYFSKQAGTPDIKPFYYSLQLNNYYFIILDTDVKNEKDSIINNQLQWLRAQLKLASELTNIKGIFLFMHRPVFRQGANLGHTQNNAQELHQLFQKHTKILAVFAGHDHIFHYQEKDGIRYVISGGGGSPLRQGYGGDYYHFLKISFNNAQNSINLKTIGVFNEIIEEKDILPGN